LNVLSCRRRSVRAFSLFARRASVARVFRNAVFRNAVFRNAVFRKCGVSQCGSFVALHSGLFAANLRYCRGLALSR
jgi:hypothetical protein